MGLLMVMTLALLIYSIGQRCLHKALKRSSRDSPPIKYAKKQSTRLFFGFFNFYRESS